MKKNSNHPTSILNAITIALAVPLFILISQTSSLAVQPQVATGDYHTAGVKSDGTVVAVGRNDDSQLNVGSWTDIVQVAAGEFHTVGVKSDGTVVAVGYDWHGQLDVGSWTDIVQVAAGGHVTLGLKSDGMVVAGGNNYYGESNVASWTDILQVATGGHHTVGVKSNGTVVAVGYNGYGQLNVDSWTDIVQVAAGRRHTVGVKSDGTVVAVGRNDDSQLNVGSWTDIVQVAAGRRHTVGVKSDGTAVAVGWNLYDQLNVGSWTDIEQVAAGGLHTVGVQSNGTVLAVGANFSGQCDVGDWDLQPDFTDVPTGYWAEDAIYKIYEAGITKGCCQDPLKYCPYDTVTRTQMAVFLGRALHGSNFTLPPATGIFADVPKSFWAAGWIEQFFKDGLTKGCKVDPHDPQAPVIYYCPKYPVTRTTMAIFLLRAKHGGKYQPPPATGIFGDVWVNYWAAAWIEQLYKEGITKGCNQNPLLYCPEKHVTRAQMAAFLARMLGL